MDLSWRRNPAITVGVGEEVSCQAIVKEMSLYIGQATEYSFVDISGDSYAERLQQDSDNFLTAI
jgi:hypothetical protein